MAHFESSAQSLQTFAEIYNNGKMPKTNNTSLDEISKESSEQLYFIVSMIPQLSRESEDFKRVGQLIIELAKIAPFFDDPKSLKDIYKLKEKMEKL